MGDEEFYDEDFLSNENLNNSDISINLEDY